MHRCSWVNDDPLYIDYHDHEWGKPVYEMCIRDRVKRYQKRNKHSSSITK